MDQQDFLTKLFEDFMFSAKHTEFLIESHLKELKWQRASFFPIIISVFLMGAWTGERIETYKDDTNKVKCYLNQDAFDKLVKNMERTNADQRPSDHSDRLQYTDSYQD